MKTDDGTTIVGVEEFKDNPEALIPTLISTEIFRRSMAQLRKMFDQNVMWSGIVSAIVSDMGTLILHHPGMGKEIWDGYIKGLESVLEEIRKHPPEYFEFMKATGGDKNKAN